MIPQKNQAVQDINTPAPALIQYAAKQGAPVEAFIAAGWLPSVVMHQGRPALQFATATGPRWRFIDGRKPKYISPEGYARCWYGLERAVEQAQRLGAPLVICNGEAGTVAAQYHGVPAACITGGETGTIPPALLVELQQAYSGPLLVAYDCDETGRRAGPALAAELRAAGYTAAAIDLAGGLSEGGPDKFDLADFCKLHTGRALAALLDCPALPEVAPRHHRPRPMIVRPIEAFGRETGGAVDWPAENNLWWQDVVLPAVERAATVRRGKHFRCINPAHEDKHPSARITERGVYVCTCGAHKRDIVAAWAGAPAFIDWWKENRRALYPVRQKPAPDKSARPKGAIGLREAIGPSKPAVKPITSPLVMFTADEHISARYASEIALKARTIALKSALNTGKTEAVIRHIQQHQPARVLFITHLQALAADQAERLNRAGLITELYAEIPNDYNLGAVDRLVCSVNSLHRLAGAAPYDLVVIDEMSQAVPHIWGGTLRGDEPATAYSALRRLVETAGQVIGLDAHMSDREADWLAAVRGDCWRVENTYQHDWGALDLYASESALVAAAQACADQNAGPVVLATSSRKAARRYYRYFVQRYGVENVRAIHGWNSSAQDSRAFIANINRDLPALRLLICSPSVATGIDITAPVAGVFGAFYAEPLTAADMLQMLARYRSSAQRGAFVSAVERELETDAENLLGHVRASLRRTAQLAEYAAHGVPVATLEQAEIVRLWARYEADRNRQKQNPRGAFCALAQAEGFTVRPVEAEAPHMAEQLKAARADLRAADDLLRLTLAPLAPDELEQRRIAGTVTENDYLALDRWHIEDTTGQTISADLLARYRTPRARAALRRFTDYEAGADVVRQLDRDEAAVLPMNRKHHTGPYWLFTAAVKAMFGAAGLQSDEVISKAEAHQRAAAFTKKHLGDVQIYIDRRADLSSNPLAVVRRVFAAFGVHIAYKQVRTAGGFEYRYWLDADRLAQLRYDAERRRAHMAQKQQERDLCQNAGITHLQSRVLTQQSAAGQWPMGAPQAKGLYEANGPHGGRRADFLAPLSPQEAARIAAIQF